MSQRKDKDYHSNQHHQHYQNHNRRNEHNDMTKLLQDFISMESNSSASTLPTNQTKSPSQTASNTTASGTMSPPQKDVRLLRCFCGCSQLTYDQIETFVMMNVSGIVTNPVSNNLLKTFLKIGHRTDKSNALLLVECFELAHKISTNLNSYREYVDDLIELCPSFLWEQRLNEACEAESPQAIQTKLQEVLTALKKDCLCNIEADNDYTRFKRELLRKIGK